MYRVEIAEAAVSELVEAYNWYENQSPGLGEELLAEFEVVRGCLKERPLSYPVVYEQMRRARTRRFPYGVFYEVSEDRVVIIAFFHSKRDPDRWSR